MVQLIDESVTAFPEQQRKSTAQRNKKYQALPSQMLVDGISVVFGLFKGIC